MPLVSPLVQDAPLPAQAWPVLTRASRDSAGPRARYRYRGDQGPTWVTHSAGASAITPEPSRAAPTLPAPPRPQPLGSTGWPLREASTPVGREQQPLLRAPRTGPSRSGRLRKMQAGCAKGISGLICFHSNRCLYRVVTLNNPVKQDAKALGVPFYR